MDNSKAILLIIIFLALSAQIFTQSKFIIREKSPLTSADIQKRQMETIKNLQFKKNLVIFPFQKPISVHTYLSP